MTLFIRVYVDINGDTPLDYCAKYFNYNCFAWNEI